MSILEELKRELKNKKVELRKYETELEQKTDTFEKLREEFEEKYATDIEGCLYDPDEEEYDNYVWTCYEIKQAIGDTEEYRDAKERLEYLMDEYIRITEGELPRKIERARRDISNIEWKIERMEGSES